MEPGDALPRPIHLTTEDPETVLLPVRLEDGIESMLTGRAQGP